MRFRGAILASGVSFLALAASLAGGSAFAGGVTPSGGQFAAGAGSIAATNNGLAITQSTAQGIINWQNFSIGQGNAVSIANGAGATLNRVTGGNISSIAGSLTSTGSVYLINPAGVIVMPTGQVVTTGSFVASTRDVSDSSFLAGGAQEFKGTSSGTVVNQGSITSSNGNVVLIGQSVTNSGQISAPNGAVGLAAGEDVLLQPSGSDQTIQVNAGTGDVTNSGTIAAAQAELNASGGNVYALATNNGGIIRATGSATRNGHVYLTAGDNITVDGAVSATNADGSGGTVTAKAGATGGTLSVTGAVNVSATSASAKGGTATLTANTVNVGATAKIAANGGTGGGTLFIGGDRHGGSDPSVALSATPIANAQYTTVAAGAQISANGGVGGGAGNGGNVIVWSDVSTNYAGSISAQGGVSGGNGGFVEVSGEQHLSFTGNVSTLAPLGTLGTLLLDPSDVTIINANDTSAVTLSSGTPTSNDTYSGGTYTPNGTGGTFVQSGTGTNSSYILNSDIQTMLASNNVTITTSNAAGTNQGNIHLGTSGNGASISWSSASTLTLTADGVIDMPGGLNTDPVSGLVSGLYATGSGAITLNAGGAGVAAGGTVITIGSAISANGGAISLNSTTLNQNYRVVVSNGITLSNTIVNGAGLISVSADELRVGNGAFSETGAITTTGDVKIIPVSTTALLIGNNSSVGNLSTYSFTNNTTLINEPSIVNITAKDLVIGNSSTTTSITLTTPSGNPNTISAPHINNIELLTGTTGTITQDANTPLSVNAGAGGLAISAGGAINLPLSNLVSSLAVRQTGAIAGNVIINGQSVASSSGTLAIGTVNDISGITTTGSNAVTLDNSGTVTQSTATTSQAIATSNLVLRGGGSFTLDNLANSISNIAANVSTLSLTDNSALTTASLSDNLASPTTYNGITGTGNITIVDNGLLTIANGAPIATSAGNVLLEDNTFTNSDGTAAFAVTGAGDYWRVYSQDPRHDNDGALASANYSFVQYAAANSYGAPGAATTFTNANAVLTAAGNYGTGTGNGFLYSVSPTVTESVSNAFTKVYDGNTTYAGAGGASETLTYNAQVVKLGSTVVTNLGAGGTADTVTLTKTASMSLPQTGFYASPNVGTYPLTTLPGVSVSLASAVDKNSVTVYGYSVSPNVSGSASITAKPITITGSRVYNQGATTLTSTYSSINAQLVASDIGSVSLSGTGAAALGSPNAGSYSTANTGATSLSLTNLALTGGASNNYAIVSGTYTVTPYSITVSGTRPYDTTTAASSSVLASIASQELAGDPALTLTGTGSVASPNASVTAQALTTAAGVVSGLSLSGTGSGNYAITSGTLTITPVPLTITGTKVYDTTTNFGTSQLSVNSPISGQTITLTGGTGTSSSPNVNTSPGYANSTLTGPTISVSGGLASNYTVPTTGTLYITPAILTLTNASGGKVYDGTTSVPAVDITSLSNLQGGDSLGGDLTLTGAGSITSPNVGSYTGSTSTFSIAGLTLGGSAAGNYTLGAGTFSVSPKPVTATGSRVYNGLMSAASGTFTTPLSGVLVADSANVGLTGSGTLNSANVGSYSTANGAASATNGLTPNTLALNGSEAGNYTLVTVNYSVTAAPAITITASPQSKTYGTVGALGTTAFTTVGLVGGDTVGGVTLASTGTPATAPATTYAIVPSAETGGTFNPANYAGVNYVNGVLTVNPAAILVSADPQTKVYGSSDPTTLTYTDTGLVNGDPNPLIGALSRNPGETVLGGPYAITQGTLSSTNSNYTISYTGNNLTITPKPLTITGTKVYDSTTADAASTFGAFTSQLVSGDSGNVTLTGVGALGGANVGGYSSANGAASVSNGTSQNTLALTGSAASNYAVTLTNYSITPEPIIITSVPTSKIYDGTPTSPGTPIVTTGTIYGPDVGVFTQLYNTPIVGTGLTLTPTGGIIGNPGNYTVTYAPVYTGIITPAPLVISGTRVYDGLPDAPGLILTTITGEIPGDPALTVTGIGTLASKNASSTPTIISAFGTLALTGIGSGNYIIASGTVEVTPTPLVISAVNTTKVYDGGVSSVGLPTYSGLLTGDTISALYQTYFSRNVLGLNGSTLNVSPTYTIVDGNGGGNYSVTLVASPGTITPEPLTVTAVPTTKPYDGTSTSPGRPIVTAGVIYGPDAGRFIEIYGSTAVGTGLTLTPSGNVNDGNGGANYTVTYVPITTGTIDAQVPNIDIPFNQTAAGEGASPADFTIYNGGILYIRPTQNGIVTGTIATIDGQNYEPDAQLGCTLGATGACLQNGVNSDGATASTGAN